MPSRASHPCRSPHCIAMVTTPYCPDHTRQPQPTDRGSSTAQGYGAAWRRIRAYYLAHEPLCRVCHDAGRTTLATDVDHIIPRTSGGSDGDANLQSLCHAHHSQKTARANGGFERATR